MGLGLRWKFRTARADEINPQPRLPASLTPSSTLCCGGFFRGVSDLVANADSSNISRGSFTPKLPRLRTRLQRAQNYCELQKPPPMVRFSWRSWAVLGGLQHRYVCE